MKNTLDQNKIDKPLVINTFGGPGCGKSTISAAVFSLLKMHEVNAELVTEFAKDLTWENRQNVLENNQYYVWGKQYHRIMRLVDQVDVIVTDGPLLLGVMYGKKPECFDETMIRGFKEFNNLNYFLLRMKKYNPKGRNQTEEESKELDQKIMQLMIDNDVQFKIEPGNYEGINDIAKRVLRRLGKEMKVYFVEKK